jgi:hypothetical protein
MRIREAQNTYGSYGSGSATLAASRIMLMLVDPVLDLAGVLTSYLAAGSKRRQENVENIPVTMDPLLKLHHLRSTE